jgi:hypothetical protein
MTGGGATQRLHREVGDGGVDLAAMTATGAVHWLSVYKPQHAVTRLTPPACVALRLGLDHCVFDLPNGCDPLLSGDGGGGVKACGGLWSLMAIMQLMNVSAASADPSKFTYQGVSVPLWKISESVREL